MSQKGGRKCKKLEKSDSEKTYRPRITQRWGCKIVRVDCGNLAPWAAIIEPTTSKNARMSADDLSGYFQRYSEAEAINMLSSDCKQKTT